MTDMELLELAAKAAGYKFAINGDGLPGYVAASNGDWRCGWCYWNPLNNNGQAMCLAVDLHLSVNITPSYTQVTRGSVFVEELTSGSEQKHGDKYLYARRAIVRAAAEIERKKNV